jgi:hypothetical protein
MDNVLPVPQILARTGLSGIEKPEWKWRTERPSATHCSPFDVALPMNGPQPNIKSLFLFLICEICEICGQIALFKLRDGNNFRVVSGFGFGFWADVDDQAVVFDVVAVGFGYFFLGGFDFVADEFDDFAGFDADHVVVVYA